MSYYFSTNVLKDLDRLLVVSNLNPVGKQTYDYVIENALRYYSDEQYRKAVDEMILAQSLCS